MKGILSSIPWGTIAKGVVLGALTFKGLQTAVGAAGAWATKQMFGSAAEMISGETVKSKGIFSKASSFIAEDFKKTSQRMSARTAKLGSGLASISDKVIPDMSKKISAASSSLVTKLGNMAGGAGKFAGMLGKGAGILGAGYAAFETGQAIGNWMNDNWGASDWLSDRLSDMFGPELPDFNEAKAETPEKTPTSIREMRKGKPNKPPAPETAFTKNAEAPTPKPFELELPEMLKMVEEQDNKEDGKSEVKDELTHQLLTKLEVHLRYIREQTE
jgi:hypothetical protein